MTSKTLKNAILDVIVANYLNPRKSFSSYNITQLLRNDVNSKRYTIDEFVNIPTTFGQEVEHQKVRNTVKSIEIDGLITGTFNGTFTEYTITPNNVLIKGVTTNKPDITFHPLYNRYITLIKELVNKDNVSPSDKLIGDLGLDSLDCVELMLAIEYEFSKEFPGLEINENDINDSDMTVSQSFEKLLKITSELNNTSKKAVPNQSVQVDVKVELKGYLISRFSKYVYPTLKNAQKAVNVPGTSVRTISDIAKELGYKVVGNQSIPFNQWVITNV